jgi:hypothetical protein
MKGGPKRLCQCAKARPAEELARQGKYPITVEPTHKLKPHGKQARLAEGSLELRLERINHGANLRFQELQRFYDRKLVLERYLEGEAELHVHVLGRERIVGRELRACLVVVNRGLSAAERRPAKYGASEGGGHVPETANAFQRENLEVSIYEPDQGDERSMLVGVRETAQGGEPLPAAVRPKKGEPVEIPVPKRQTFIRNLNRAIRADPERVEPKPKRRPQK